MRQKDDVISRADAIDDLRGKDPSQVWDTADVEVWVNALPSAQPETFLMPMKVTLKPEEIERVVSRIKDAPIMVLPSAEPVDKDINVPTNDTISRQAAIEAFRKELGVEETESGREYAIGFFGIERVLNDLPSAQPTLYGYNIEHLKLIANVLQKEDLPPERVAEAFK